jgi:hypothetical protein
MSDYTPGQHRQLVIDYNVAVSNALDRPWLNAIFPGQRDLSNVKPTWLVEYVNHHLATTFSEKAILRVARAEEKQVVMLEVKSELEAIRQDLMFKPGMPPVPYEYLYAGYQ